MYDKRQMLELGIPAATIHKLRVMRQAEHEYQSRMIRTLPRPERERIYAELKLIARMEEPLNV